MIQHSNSLTMRYQKPNLFMVMSPQIFESVNKYCKGTRCEDGVIISCSVAVCLCVSVREN